MIQCKCHADLKITQASRAVIRSIKSYTRCLLWASGLHLSIVEPWHQISHIQEMYINPSSLSMAFVCSVLKIVFTQNSWLWLDAVLAKQIINWILLFNFGTHLAECSRNIPGPVLKNSSWLAGLWGPHIVHGFFVQRKTPYCYITAVA